MCATSAIQVDHLAKTYRIHRKEPGLVGSLKSLVRCRHEQVPALEAVSFQVWEGEFLGLIGPINHSAASQPSLVVAMPDHPIQLPHWRTDRRGER